MGKTEHFVTNFFEKRQKILEDSFSCHIFIVAIGGEGAFYEVLSQQEQKALSNRIWIYFSLQYPICSI